MALDITPNPRGIAEVLRGPGVRRELQRRADRVAMAMRVAVPVLTGDAKSSIRVEVEPSGDRLVARVRLNVPYGMKLARRYPSIARSLDAAAGP